MMRTGDPKDEETCDTCIEFYEDLKILIASDYGVNNFNAFIWVVRLLIISKIQKSTLSSVFQVCEFVYMATPRGENDLEQCKQNHITIDVAQRAADEIDPEYECTISNFCNETLLPSEKLRTVGLKDDDDMCGTCIEMFEDFMTLMSSDEEKENIITEGDMVFNPEYC